MGGTQGSRRPGWKRSTLFGTLPGGMGVHREVAAMRISVSILSQAVRPRKMWTKNVKMLKYDKRCQLLIVLKKAAWKDMSDTRFLFISCKMSKNHALVLQ